MINQKEAEDKLWKIFANVNDWLKVAETKNAMLIGFNGASIFGLSRVMGSIDSGLWWYFFMVCLIFIASLITSLVSFVPRLVDLPFSSVSKSKFKNLYFFEYLKDLTMENLLKEHFKEPEGGVFPDSLKDLAGQIISNSKIASLKYSYFTIAIWLTICGIVTPIIGGLIFMTWYSKQVKL